MAVGFRGARPAAQRNIRISTKDGGSVSNIVFRDVNTTQQTDLPAIWSNAPGSYTLTDVLLNGTPVTA